MESSDSDRTLAEIQLDIFRDAVKPLGEWLETNMPPLMRRIGELYRYLVRHGYIMPALPPQRPYKWHGTPATPRAPRHRAALRRARIRARASAQRRV